MIWRRTYEALTNVKRYYNLAFGPWTVLENNAVVHICIKDWGADDGDKEVVRQCLRRKGRAEYRY